MEIFYKLKPLEKDSCVALGFFDGVHLGHQAVINNAIRMAKENKMASIVFTFSEKPNSRSNETITTNAQKAVIFKKMGVENLFVLSPADIMHITANDFVEIILHKNLKAKHVFCGQNYHFGKGGLSTAKDLENLCNKFNIKVHISSLVADEKGNISSSRIKILLKEGRVEQASKLMGRSV